MALIAVDRSTAVINVNFESELHVHVGRLAYSASRACLRVSRSKCRSDPAWQFDMVGGPPGRSKSKMEAARGSSIDLTYLGQLATLVAEHCSTSVLPIDCRALRCIFFNRDQTSGNLFELKPRLKPTFGT